MGKKIQVKNIRTGIVSEMSESHWNKIKDEPLWRGVFKPVDGKNSCQKHLQKNAGEFEGGGSAIGAKKKYWLNFRCFGKALKTKKPCTSTGLFVINLYC